MASASVSRVSVSGAFDPLVASVSGVGATSAGDGGAELAVADGEAPVGRSAGGVAGATLAGLFSAEVTGTCSAVVGSASRGAGCSTVVSRGFTVVVGDSGATGAKSGSVVGATVCGAGSGAGAGSGSGSGSGAWIAGGAATLGGAGGFRWRNWRRQGLRNLGFDLGFRDLLRNNQFRLRSTDRGRRDDRFGLRVRERRRNPAGERGQRNDDARRQYGDDTSLRTKFKWCTHRASTPLTLKERGALRHSCHSQPSPPTPAWYQQVAAAIRK